MGARGKKFFPRLLSCFAPCLHPRFSLSRSLVLFSVSALHPEDYYFHITSFPTYLIAFCSLWNPFSATVCCRRTPLPYMFQPAFLTSHPDLHIHFTTLLQSQFSFFFLYIFYTFLGRKWAYVYRYFPT